MFLLGLLARGTAGGGGGNMYVLSPVFITMVEVLLLKVFDGSLNDWPSDLESLNVLALFCISVTLKISPSSDGLRMSCLYCVCASNAPLLRISLRREFTSEQRTTLV